MRFFAFGFLVTVALSVCLAGSAAFAQGELNPEDFLPDENLLEEEMLTPDDDVVSPPADDVPLALQPQTPRIDALFDDLKRAANSSYAATIADSIWAEWFRSGSATTDLMMRWANDATQKRNFNIALDFLDQVVTKDPDYAEGWNRRATVHYMMNNFAKSMSDINRVLELEPRHFGALSGMAMILERSGRKKAARDAWMRTLEIYPAMQSAQNALIRLEDELAGEPI